MHFGIQSVRIYAVARENKDGTYTLFDLLSNKMFFVFGWKDKKALNTNLGLDPVPALVVVGEEGFKKLVNIDPQCFSEQLKRFPVTTGNQIALNQKLFEMLSAYDEGALQPDALLACAIILAEKLHELEPSSALYLINLMQAIKRKRNFDPEEEEDLRNLILDTNEMEIKFAAYALLGYLDIAKDCLDRCSDEKKQQLKTYPISHFIESK